MIYYFLICQKEHTSPKKQKDKGSTDLEREPPNMLADESFREGEAKTEKDLPFNISRCR